MPEDIFGKCLMLLQIPFSVTKSFNKILFLFYKNPNLGRQLFKKYVLSVLVLLAALLFGEL